MRSYSRKLLQSVIIVIIDIIAIPAIMSITMNTNIIFWKMIHVVDL